MNRLTKKIENPQYSNDYEMLCTHGYHLINKLGKLEDIEEEQGCPLEVREKALNGFYIPSYGYVSNDDDFIYLRKDDKGYYLKVVIHPSKPTPPHFYGYCDIHYLKDYKKTWWLSETKEE